MADLNAEPGDPNRFGFQDRHVRKKAQIKDPSTGYPDNPPGWKENMGNRIERTAKEERQAKFCTLYAEGMTIDAAMEQINMSPNTYYKWREDPRFQEILREARARHKQNQPDRQWIDDFKALRMKYWGLETYQIHEPMIKMLDKHKVVAGSMEHKTAMFLIYPGAGKSTTICDYICNLIKDNPNIRILYWSESSALSKKMVGRVKARLYTKGGGNKFADDFGPFYVEGQHKEGKPWQANYFTVNAKTADQANYTLEAKGMDTSIYGDRFDIIIIDDAQSDKTKGQTEKIVTRLVGDVFNRLDSNGGFAIYIGTRVQAYDVPSELVKKGIIDRGDVVEIPFMDKDGKIACPEMNPPVKVASLRKTNPEPSWSIRYLLKPNSAESQVFKDPTLVKIRAPLLSPDVQHPTDPMLISVDPALGGWCVLTASAYGQDKFTGINQWSKKGLDSYEDIFLMLAHWLPEYRPKKVVLEKTGFQGGLLTAPTLLDLQQKYGFDIEPADTLKWKNDKDYGILEMNQAMVRGEILISYLVPEVWDKFLQECRDWRSNEKANVILQDTVMSFWFGWTNWQQQRTPEVITDLSYAMEPSPYGVRNPIFAQPITHIQAAPSWGAHQVS